MKKIRLRPLCPHQLCPLRVIVNAGFRGAAFPQIVDVFMGYGLQLIQSRLAFCYDFIFAQEKLLAEYEAPEAGGFYTDKIVHMIVPKSMEEKQAEESTGIAAGAAEDASQVLPCLFSHHFQRIFPVTNPAAGFSVFPSCFTSFSFVIF